MVIRSLSPPHITASPFPHKLKQKKKINTSGGHQLMRRHQPAVFRVQPQHYHPLLIPPSHSLDVGSATTKTVGCSGSASTLRACDPFHSIAPQAPRIPLHRT